MYKYPVLYDRNMNKKGVICPESLSVSLKMNPLSVASMEIHESADIAMQDFLLIFMPDGNDQYFRVKAITHTASGMVNVQMEHSIVWLEDFILPEKGEGKTETPQTILTRLLNRVKDTTKWQIGAVEATEAIEFDYDHPNIMQALVDVLNLCPDYMYTFDQMGDAWVLNMVAMPTAVSCEGRISRNLVSAPRIDYNDSEQCTRAYVSGKDWYVDADNIAEAGLIERVIALDTEGVSDQELREQCEEYVEKHKNPAMSVTVDALELQRQTAQPFDRFREGDICRLCLVDYGGIILQDRILSRTYPDILKMPDYVQLQIANFARNASSQINGITVTQKKIVAQMKADFSKVYSGIETVDGRLTTVYNEVGLELDEQRAAINMKAESTQVDELGGRLNAAEVEIDGLNGEIELKATKQEVSKLSGEFDDLESTVTVSVDGLRASVQDGDKTISELKTTVDGLENWVTDSDGNVSELTNTVRGLESSVTTVDGKVSTLTNTADGLTSTITAQGVTMAELKTRIDEISTTVKNSDEQMGQLIVKADSVTATVGQIGESVSQWQVDLDGVHGLVEDLEEDTSSKFEMIAGLIEMETKADGTVVSLRLDAADNRIDLKADKTYVDGLVAKYVETTSLKAVIAAIDVLSTQALQVNGTLTASSGATITGNVGIVSGDLTMAGTLTTKNLKADTLYLSAKYGTWQSGTFVTGVTLPDYEPTFQTINYVSYVDGVATSKQITVMTGITKKEAGSVGKSTINYVGA